MVMTMMTDKQKAALARRMRKRELTCIPSEGFCLPAWLSDCGRYERQHAALGGEGQPKKAGSASWHNRQQALCVLLHDIHGELVQMHLAYPGSRAERAYKDLYTTIRGELSALQNMGSSDND